MGDTNICFFHRCTVRYYQRAPARVVSLRRLRCSAIVELCLRYRVSLCTYISVSTCDLRPLLYPRVLVLLIDMIDMCGVIIYIIGTSLSNACCLQRMPASIGTEAHSRC
ncbi:hypothetical protein M430DRAFT_179767 [Amorphotheca resinae ATCC 22711]|uniref:Uncharacterized protein n=1 Tax=Amorphotheca resinae ATCC 22711 TaxID=857342 RepID=A0A2T3ATN8_AMORE|nr:hypothetical protein M430DRAFT_179767 [Amorphotheca resinae ATCC 22711]PSS10840.1 hypothetical protein M430DRAFT_179767 [Amorphotheca resinae ATCC 22711]